MFTEYTIEKLSSICLNLRQENKGKKPKFQTRKHVLYKSTTTDYSQAILVSKLLRQMANA